MALVRKGTTSVMLLAALIAILVSAAAVHSYMKHHRPARYHTYIVLLWPPPDADAMDKDAHHRWHQSFLPGTLTDSGEPRLLCSYTTVFNGFAARLTDAELQAVAKKPGFLRAFPERTRHYLERWHEAGGRHGSLRCFRKAAGRRCRGSLSRRG